MTGQEVRAMADEEITAELKKLRERLFGLRMQKVTGKVEDTASFGKARKDIARLLTERRARALRTEHAGA